MNHQHSSHSSFAPGGYGAPSPYGAPGALSPAGAPGAFSPTVPEGAGYPSGGYGLPSGFPPEQVPPGYNPRLGTFAGPRYASVWARIGAYLIDGIVLGAINVVAQILFVGISGTALVGDDAGIAVTALIAFFILIFVLDAIYVVAQEAASGQTLGKRALRIKVVKADGSQMDVDAALIRYVFLFFAFVGLGGLVTLLSVALSDTKQRIGDRVAGTIVVTAG